ATLIHVKRIEENPLESPPAGRYIYHLTAEATTPILGGATTQKAEASVKYSYITEIYLHISERTEPEEAGEDATGPGQSVEGRLGVVGGLTMIYYEDLDLPPGLYDVSYIATYDETGNDAWSSVGDWTVRRNEDVYIRLGNSSILLKEWDDNGDGNSNEGEPCVAGDGIACAGEFNIPLEMQDTLFPEEFTYITDTGIHDQPQDFFEVGREPFIGEFACTTKTSGVIVVALCEKKDLDWEPDSRCRRMCKVIDRDCTPDQCHQQCIDSCISYFQPNHPDSECHRRCDPAYCMSLCAKEYQPSYIGSQCAQKHCPGGDCGDDLNFPDLQECVRQQELGLEDNTECMDFCDPEVCMEKCSTEFQRQYDGNRSSLTSFALMGAEAGPAPKQYKSECNQMCAAISRGRKGCLNQCNRKFVNYEMQGDLLIYPALRQTPGINHTLQQQVLFDSFRIRPKTPGATITEISWLSNPPPVEPPKKKKRPPASPFR
ncbi:hypothetical protein ACFL1E_07405, partial [Candidatus Omnitrophota bacterium]